MSFNIADMVISKPKPYPILLLLDGSASMNTGGRIGTLNEAVDELLLALTREEQKGFEFLVSIIVFRGEQAELLHKGVPPSKLNYTPIEARSTTPLGSALQVATELIEDPINTPSRAYRPLVVLVCDGLPTDDWQGKLERFVSEGRTSKCDRMALGVGDQLPERAQEMLRRFVEGTGHDVMSATESSEITRFFKFITMSVVVRSKSKNPKLIPDQQQVWQAVGSLTTIEETEFQNLVNEMRPLGFVESSEVSKYIINNHLCDRYPHISGCAQMSSGYCSWRFNGAIAPRYYARLCSALNLSDKRSGARVQRFSSYASMS